MNGRQSRRAPRRKHAGAAPARHARHAIADWTQGMPVFVPQGYEAGYDYPLLVWLTDPTSAGFDLGRVMARLSLRNFVAVEATGGSTAVWRAIDRVGDRLSIHPRRVWLIGHAAGGTEAFRVACRHPESFAGCVSLGGPFPLDEAIFSRIDAVRRMPMLHCCSSEAAAAGAAHTDRTLRLFHAAGAMLAMRIYPGAGDLSKAMLGDVNRWLMEETCGSSTGQHAHATG
jgi:pimeloyl-ACP methyl ester carboxylesterase